MYFVCKLLHFPSPGSSKLQNYYSIFTHHTHAYNLAAEARISDNNNNNSSNVAVAASILFLKNYNSSRYINLSSLSSNSNSSHHFYAQRISKKKIVS